MTQNIHFMFKPLKILLIVLGIIAAVLLIWTGFSLIVISRIPSPKYTIVKQLNGYDFRMYEPYTIAEVMVKGDFPTAVASGTAMLSAHFPKTSVMREIITGNLAEYHMISFIIQLGTSTVATTTDPNIRFYPIEDEKIASLNFSGYATPARIEQMRRVLMNHLTTDQRIAFSDPIYVNYTPWYVIWFLQRHEIEVVI